MIYFVINSDVRWPCDTGKNHLIKHGTNSVLLTLIYSVQQKLLCFMLTDFWRSTLGKGNVLQHFSEAMHSFDM